MRSEKRLLEGKCITCLQVYEGLLLLYRCWLLRAFLALPFSRATDVRLPELQPLQEWISLTCPPHYSPQPRQSGSTLSHTWRWYPSAVCYPIPHFRGLPPPRPCCCPAQSWPGGSLLPTPNSTHILSTYCVSGTVPNVLLKSSSFVFQMKIPMPKKNKVISPSS